MAIKRKVVRKQVVVSSIPTYALAAAAAEKLFRSQDILAICRGDQTYYEVSVDRKAMLTVFYQGNDPDKTVPLIKAKGPLTYKAGVF